MILGWGVEDETLTGISRMLSAYTSTSDTGLFIAGILGLIVITIEGLSFFGIYRLIVPYSEKYAHIYRSGIFGWMFSSLRAVSMFPYAWLFFSRSIRLRPESWRNMPSVSYCFQSFSFSYSF